MKQIKLFILIMVVSGWSVAQENDTTSTNGDRTKVFVFDIRASIDARTNRLSELALEESININADYVIIDMNTFGGALQDADEMRTRILDFEKPIYVFINNNAASAGALISIATDSIYMTPGASIGAATVVGPDGAAAPDKYQSYMRSIMRSTAEAQGRDPRIAEAMVDESLEVDTISPAGQVITFSTFEAIRYGYCEAAVESIDGLLERAGIDDYELIRFELDPSEKIIAFFINPVVSGILILIILGGIYFELQTPGIGFPILASLIALVLYLTPYYLNGLAANWEILAFFAGIGLLALELFVIPGFGIAGVGGLVLTIGSLILVMLNNDFFDFQFVPIEEVYVAISSTLAGLLGGVIMMIFGGVRLVNTKFFKSVALEDVQDRLQGYTANFRTETLMGKKGTTYTVLRPSGKILIEGEIYDAYTRGEYIDKSSEVVVIDESGTSLKVKKAEPED